MGASKYRVTKSPCDCPLQILELSPLKVTPSGAYRLVMAAFLLFAADSSKLIVTAVADWLATSSKVATIALRKTLNKLEVW